MEEEIAKIEKYVKTPHVYGIDVSFFKYDVPLPDPSFDIYVRQEDEGTKQMLERRVLRNAVVTENSRIFDNAKVATFGEQVVEVLDLSDLLLEVLGEARPLPALVSAIPVALALNPGAVDVEYVVATTRDKSFIQKLGFLFEIADYLNPDPDVKAKLRVLRRFYPFEAGTWILNPPPATDQGVDEEKSFRSKNRILTIQAFWKCEQTPLMEEFEAQFRLFVPEEMMKWRYEPRITKKGPRVRREFPNHPKAAWTEKKE
jgi:hypothetical protein